MSQLTRTFGRNPRWVWLAAGALLLATAAFALVWIGRASAEQGGVAAPSGVSKFVSTLVSGQDVAVSCAGKQTKQAYANHGDQNATTSTSFVNLPGATVPFSVSSRGGAKCVSVLFTSMAFANPDELLIVRSLLDGAVAGNPADTSFVAQSVSNFAASHAMNFTFSAVAPGPHTIQMQFRSFFGGFVALHRGTTIVLYG